MAEGVPQPPMVRRTGEGDPTEGPSVIVDNRTGLADNRVMDAVMAHWVENAAMQFGQPSSFQLYSTSPSGSMLARSPFQVPRTVVDEIRLARSVADTDDDVMAVIGQAVATAFGDGMQNQHVDEQTVLLFNKICGPSATGGMNMDGLLKEMYREYLIAASFTTISLFTRTRYTVTPTGADSAEPIQAQLATPLVGILPAEDIRVVSNDLFGEGELAYDPPQGPLRDWLNDFFGDGISAARRNKLATDEPVLAALFTGRLQINAFDPDPVLAGHTVYTMNPRMVHRTTMPKGASAYPRPMLTANFALLEAKRLLNIMDYSLLQGGTNYIVVAKVGSDQHPGKQPEVDNLTEQVRLASRTGVLVGDHRVTLEVITPDLKELLNPAKRTLLGRKLAMAMLRIPEQVTGDPGNAGAAQELEFTSRSVTSDRRDIKRHIEGTIYAETVVRNRSTFTKDAPSIWFPKIVLSGVKDFFASVLQARDRGDIPRKWAVETLGFDYEAGLAERGREKQRGDDDVLTPAFVPNQGTDGGQGRPPGSSSNNGRPGADTPPIDGPQRQNQPHLQTNGEDIIATWDGERVIRYGELTAALLDAHPDHTVGRVMSVEREAIEQNLPLMRGGAIVLPVNPGHESAELRAFRLTDGVSMIVGQRTDGTILARALSFREPQFSVHSAEEAAMRWGFIAATRRRQPRTCPHCGNELPSYSPALAGICPNCGGDIQAEQAMRRSVVAEVVARVMENPSLLEVAAQAVATALGGLVPPVHIENHPPAALPPAPPAPAEPPAS